MFYPIKPNVQTCSPDQNSELQGKNQMLHVSIMLLLRYVFNSRYANSVIYNWTHSSYFVISYFGDSALLLLDAVSVYSQWQ